MDPLSLLREFCMKGKLDKVKMSGGRVDFGDDYSFDEKMATTFKSQRGALYSLQAVVFFIKNDEGYGQYLQTAMKAEVDTVARVDVKEVTDYLMGTIETCAKIAALDSLPMGVPPIGKRSLEETGDSTGVEPKRQRTDSGDGEADEGETVEDRKVSDGGEKKSWTINSILKQERQLRDRNIQLVCPGKDFSFASEMAKKHMQDFRHKIKTNAERRSAAAQEGHRGSSDRRPKIPVRPSNRYERPLPQNEAENLGGPQFAGMGVSLYGMRSVDGVRRSEAGDAPSRHQAHSGHGSRRHDTHRRTSHRGDHRMDPGHRHSRPNPESMMPIILVPAGMSATINMYNARYLLEDAKYISVEECRKMNPRKKDCEVVKRVFDRKRPVKYQLLEKPPPKDSSDWERVVAVISQGVKWQFKDFPFKGADQGNMMETFTKIQGFYFALHDEELNALVKSWNVQVIVIHKDNRHNDIPVMQEFFRKLDASLQTKKTRLIY